MLGIGESTQYWRWGACGKHPVARDYFNVGHSVPLLKAFADWVEKGYQGAAAKRDLNTTIHSWRFWARGTGKGSLACGLLRDSSDHIGRSYPLLIMGSGALKGWEEQWDLLTFACERTWNQTEYLATKTFNNLKTLEEEVHKIKPPHSEWPGFVHERRNLLKSGATSGRADLLKRLEDTVSSVSGKTVIMECLDYNSFRDHFTLVTLWHSFLKAFMPDLPNAVFMGGTPETTYFAVFKRPLLPDDFVRLWSIPSEELRENGTLVAR